MYTSICIDTCIYANSFQRWKLPPRGGEAVLPSTSAGNVEPAGPPDYRELPGRYVPGLREAAAVPLKGPFRLIYGRFRVGIR